MRDDGTTYWGVSALCGIWLVWSCCEDCDACDDVWERDWSWFSMNKNKWMRVDDHISLPLWQTNMHNLFLFYASLFFLHFLFGSVNTSFVFDLSSIRTLGSFSDLPHFAPSLSWDGLPLLYASNMNKYAMVWCIYRIAELEFLRNSIHCITSPLMIFRLVKHDFVNAMIYL